MGGGEEIEEEGGGCEMPPPQKPPTPVQEKQDKVVLQAEVADLRQDNRRLQEESQSASEQLRRFARLFATNPPPKKEL